MPAMMRCLSSYFEVTRMWRRTERANLEKKPSTRLSQEPCLGVKVNSKRPRRSRGEPSPGFFGDVRGMIIEDQLDRCVGRIGGVERFEKLDEFLAAVAIFDQAWTLPVTRSMPANKLTVPWRLYSCSRAKVACEPGLGGRSGPVVAMAWIPGFSS
jgi:hypothetical protein